MTSAVPAEQFGIVEVDVTQVVPPLLSITATDPAPQDGVGGGTEAATHEPLACRSAPGPQGGAAGGASTQVLI